MGKDITGDCLENDWLSLNKLHRRHSLHRDYGPSGQHDSDDGKACRDVGDDESDGEECEDEI